MRARRSFRSPLLCSASVLSGELTADVGGLRMTWCLAFHPVLPHGAVNDWPAEQTRELEECDRTALAANWLRRPRWLCVGGRTF